MIAYKFRSVAKIDFTLDIIMNNRLFCADWWNLNDPMEGQFYYQAPSGMSQEERGIWIKNLQKAKAEYKICSLSQSFQSHLMWAHYADEFRGVAIEVELPEGHPDIKPVKSRGVFAGLSADDFEDTDVAARKIMFSKYHEWEYEKEIRILSKEPFFSEGLKVRKVIAGHRMNQDLFDVLNLTCQKLGVQFRRLGIGDEGLDADDVKPFDGFRKRKEPRHSRELDTWGNRGIFKYEGSINNGATIYYGEGFVNPVHISREQLILLLKKFNGLSIPMGTSRDKPPKGSVGEWLIQNVTPTALASYVGSILVYEGYARKEGKNIQFN